MFVCVFLTRIVHRFAEHFDWKAKFPELADVQGPLDAVDHLMDIDVGPIYCGMELEPRLGPVLSSSKKLGVPKFFGWVFPSLSLGVPEP